MSTTNRIYKHTRRGSIEYHISKRQIHTESLKVVISVCFHCANLSKTHGDVSQWFVEHN